MIPFKKRYFISRLVNDGFPESDVAKAFRVPPSVVRRIASTKLWQVRLCVNCGGEFIDDSRVLYCCKRCAYRARRERYEARAYVRGRRARA